MEWTIVTVLGALVALGVAIVGPIVSLTKSITTLTVEVNGLRNDLAEQKKDTHDAFVKLWDHEDAQDEKITNHETRLQILEHQ